MKNKTTSNLSNALQSLALVSLVLFVMAFACKDNTETNPPRPDDKSIKKTPTKTGGRCSTEAEFKDIIQTRFHLGTFGEAYGEYKDSEIVFHKFNIAAPTAYTSTDSGYIVKVDTAYPVSTDYTTRHYKHDGTRDVNELLEYDWKSDFICYINHRDECTCDRKKYKASEARITPLDE